LTKSKINDNFQPACTLSLLKERHHVPRLPPSSLCFHGLANRTPYLLYCTLLSRSPSQQPLHRNSQRLARLQGRHDFWMVCKHRALFPHHPNLSSRNILDSRWHRLLQQLETHSSSPPPTSPTTPGPQGPAGGFFMHQ
jgi:hypothetical protein